VKEDYKEDRSYVKAFWKEVRIVHHGRTQKRKERGLKTIRKSSGVSWEKKGKTLKKLFQKGGEEESGFRQRGGGVPFGGKKGEFDKLLEGGERC